MTLLTKVFDSLKWKKNAEYCADRLGISQEQYLELKQEVIGMKQDMIEHAGENIDELIRLKLQSEAAEDEVIEDRIIERNHFIDNNKLEVKALLSSEPMSPQEIIERLKIDTTKWKLSQYWNKEKSDRWEVSALCTAKRDAELTTEDAEAIIQKVFKDKKFIPVTSYPTVSNQKALFVYLSDRHIAAHVSGVAIYENTYSEFIYESRLMEVLHEIFYQKQLHGKFEDIYIIDLGDKMDGLNGYTTRGGHKLPQNQNNREAFETAVQVERNFLDKIMEADIANHVHVYQNANSNHGGDYDYMVNRALEIYLNVKYPQVDTRIMEKFIEHIEYGNHIVLLTHGKDDQDMKHGLPLHLNDKTENYFRKYLMFHQIDPRNYTISIVKGDLHMAASQLAYGFRYRNVLSLFGGSKWIATNFGPSRPGCSLEVVDKHTDRISESNITFG